MCVWSTVGFDVQRGSDESEESGVKHDRAVAVERHVHRHKPLYTAHQPAATQRTPHTSL